ncbi:unnamed protein product, partial [Ectocarpus sp. 4 AP-2014]
MDSIAHRCKSNSRTTNRPPSSGPLGAEALQDLVNLQRTIKSVQQCTNEAGRGVTSRASKRRLEQAKCEYK